MQRVRGVPTLDLPLNTLDLPLKLQLTPCVSLAGQKDYFGGYCFVL